jgi:hypothetical protein
MFMKRSSAGVTALFLGATVLGGGDAAADQVIADDLIVQGSLCAGLDCVNNEVFGFGTLRLKENNTRIDFIDTSAGAFPTRDWRLEANSNLSGGANSFAIKDMGDDNSAGAEGGAALLTVTAGAPANSIFLSSTGSVGFGTSTPLLKLHQLKGDTPALRLEQDGSSGFTPQTWDMAGNEANFFIRDVTGGSRLPFRIRPGAPTSSIDISATGNVGIGTASPGATLTVATGRAQFTGNVRPTTGAGVEIGSAAGQGRLLVFNYGSSTFNSMTYNAIDHTFFNSNATVMTVASTGALSVNALPSCSAGVQTNGSGTFSCLVSSRQFKNIGGDLTPTVALANVMALRPQIGAYKTTPDEPEHWLIAEDVAAIDPALAGYKDGKPYTVKTQNIVADLVAVIQQQQKRIDALEKAIAR